MLQRKSLSQQPQASRSDPSAAASICNIALSLSETIPGDEPATTSSYRNLARLVRSVAFLARLRLKRRRQRRKGASSPSSLGGRVYMLPSRFPIDPVAS